MNKQIAEKLVEKFVKQLLFWDAPIEFEDRLRDYAKQLLQSKQTVTSKWLGEFTRDVFLWTPSTGMLSLLITRRLKELGIEVEENPDTDS